MPVIFPAEHRVSFVELHRAANKQGPPTERWLATGPIAVSKELKKIAFKNADKEITIISVDATESGSASTQTISKTYIEEQLNDSLPSEMGEYIGFEIYGNFLIVRKYDTEPGSISSRMVETNNSQALVFRLDNLEEQTASTVEIAGSIYQVVDGPSEHQITVTDFDGNLFIYDIRDGDKSARPTQHLKSEGHALTFFKYSSNKNWLAIRYSNQSVRVFTRKNRSALFEYFATIDCDRFSSNPKFIPGTSTLLVDGRVYTLAPSKIIKYLRSIVEKEALPTQ